MVCPLHVLTTLECILCSFQEIEIKIKKKTLPRDEQTTVSRKTNK